MVASGGDPRMRFGLLGTLEVLDKDSPRLVTGTRQRRLLTALLLRPNQVVSPDILIEDVWGEHAPRTAAHALQVGISQLRKTLGEGALVTQPSGYLLRVDPEGLDLHVFERLAGEGHQAVVEGRMDPAAGILRQALALWRGPALSEFRFEPFAQAEIARLEELRLQVLEDRIEAELLLGHHAEVMVELRSLVAQHPLRERFGAQLMLALYRCGRQADALVAYEDIRRALSEELGVDPGQALQELHTAILRQDDSLAAPEPPPGPLPTVTAPPEPAGLPPELVLPHEVRKVVTIVFCDMTGSTSFGERLDPEAVQKVMTRYYRVVRDALESHGGTVEKFIGDAVVAVFGMPWVHEDDALRAVRAAADIRPSIEALNQELERGPGVDVQARIGVHTGEVVADTAEPQAMVAGDVGNVAVRLEQAAAPGEALLSQETYSLIRDAVAVDELEPLTLRGRSEPVQAYRLLAVTPGAPGRFRRMDSTIVGRAGELRLLRDAADRSARERSMVLFTVLGFPGVGKSRLVREFVTVAASDSCVLEGHCLPYGKDITYWPVAEMLRQIAGITDLDAAKEARAKIEGLISEHPDAQRVGQCLLGLIGLGEAEARREEMFWSVRILFERLASDGPLVLIFEDLHWAEPTLLDLLDDLVDRSRGVPMFVVATARPELLESRLSWGGGKPNTMTIKLASLPEPSARQLVGNIAGSGLPRPAVDQIVSVSGGNPLFVEQLISMLIDEGKLRREDDRWVAAGRIDHVRAPATIQMLLAARLDMLDQRERLALEAACIEGVRFHASTVAELSEIDPEGLSEVLRGIVDKDLIDRELPGDEGEYRFRHVLIRDAPYQAMPKLWRAALHERFAQHLERTLGDRLDEAEEIVGYHLEQAAILRREVEPATAQVEALGQRAAARLASAGRRGASRGDLRAAVDLLQRALALLPVACETRSDALLLLGRTLHMLAREDEAQAIFSEAARIAAQLNDEVRQTRTLVEKRLAALDWLTSPYGLSGLEPVVREAKRAVATLGRAGDQVGLTRALLLLGVTIEDLEPDEARALFERAMIIAMQVGDRRGFLDAMDQLGGIYCWGPHPIEDAVDYCDRVMPEIDRFGDKILRAQALTNCYARHAAMQGQFDDARGLLEEALAAYIDIGYAHGIGSACDEAAVVEEMAADATKAAALERRVQPLLASVQGPGQQWIMWALVRLRLQLGKLDTAKTLLPSLGDDLFGRVLKARVLARAGRIHEAEELARAAVIQVRSKRVVWIDSAAEALLGLAEVLEAAAHTDEATAAAEEALPLLELKHNLVMVDRVHSFLERLRGATRVRGA